MVKYSAKCRPRCFSVDGLLHKLGAVVIVGSPLTWKRLTVPASSLAIT